jgi:hypothetical protein
MRWIIVLACTGCLASESSMPGPPTPPSESEPEIDGAHVDPYSGRCVGTVGEYPDWASCSNDLCAGRTAAICAATAGCRLAFTDAASTTAEERDFRSCLPAAPSDGTNGPCDGLDALACSRRDDCAALYLGQYPSSFKRCLAEP